MIPCRGIPDSRVALRSLFGGHCTFIISEGALVFLFFTLLSGVLKRGTGSQEYVTIITSLMAPYFEMLSSKMDWETEVKFNQRQEITNCHKNLYCDIDLDRLKS